MFHSTLHTHSVTSDDSQLPRRSIKLVCCRAIFTLKATYHFFSAKPVSKLKALNFYPFLNLCNQSFPRRIILLRGYC